MDEDFALLKLGEEFGEFMQAVLILRKQCREEKYVSDEEARAEVAKELADIVGMAIVAADRLGVDIEEALTEKWMKKVMNK
ncbi:MAG: pyrophosphatase [Candidatus Jacksonbacteria bacterium]|nr:pyrophosphatase [Candidatus Jacksonbacteria bacterium]